MRHAIQKAGHECLPILFGLVFTGSAILFYLGNFWPGTPPGLIVVPILVTLAVCTEWLTFTFNQDMQDAITARKQRGFPVLRALVSSSVSLFIFATATIGLWAPRGASSKELWAWVLASGIIGSQFLLKLTPERSKSPHSLVNIAAAIEEWVPGAAVEKQAQMAGQVFAAVAGTQTVPTLPERTVESSTAAREPLSWPKEQGASAAKRSKSQSSGESEGASNGNGTFPDRSQR